MPNFPSVKRQAFRRRQGYGGQVNVKVSMRYTLYAIRFQQAGFTFIEFISVIAIIVFLTGFIAVNLLKTQQHTSMHETVGALVSDLKQQQLKAMINDTEGRSSIDMYGIYFQSSKYTLFHGASFSGSDPANFVVNLDNNFQFSTINVPNSSIIFTKGSGEIVGYNKNNNTVTIKNINTNETQTVTINQYGTITNVN